MKKVYCLFVLMIGLLVMSGCAKPAAEVNGEKITMKSYKSVLKEKMAEHKLRGADVKEPELKEAVIQQLIGEKLLVQTAREKNISISDKELEEEVNKNRERLGKDVFNKQLNNKNIDLNEYKEMLKERLIISRLIASLVPEESIDETEIKDFYTKSPKPFVKPEKVEVKLIQTQTEQQANAIVEEMKKKKLSFDEIADILKREQKAIVSDYGWIEPAFFSEDIADGLKTLRKGKHGGPYRGKDGFYLLRVKDRQKESVKTYDEAKDEIQSLLLNQKRQAMTIHLISERRKKASIKVNIN